MLLEVCTETLEGAMAAEIGGAARIELCSHLDEDGLTPPPALMREVRTTVQLPICAMARPHAGPFHYPTEDTLFQMLTDIARLRDQGADGIVVGMLDLDGQIHVDHLERAVAAAGPLPVTFHRAFDGLRDQAAGLETLIRCGVQRVLTGGGPGPAEEHLEELAALVGQAGDRIEILVGGSVREHNLALLKSATCAEAFHSALDRAPTAASVRDLLQAGA
ncbi:MAG: copper homeostasis protein CutC [Planctomycetota bacterium]